MGKISRKMMEKIEDLSARMTKEKIKLKEEKVEVPIENSANLFKSAEEILMTYHNAVFSSLESEEERAKIYICITKIFKMNTNDSEFSLDVFSAALAFMLADFFNRKLKDRAN